MRLALVNYNYKVFKLVLYVHFLHHYFIFETIDCSVSRNSVGTEVLLYFY